MCKTILKLGPQHFQITCDYNLYAYFFCSGSYVFLTDELVFQPIKLIKLTLVWVSLLKLQS